MSHADDFNRRRRERELATCVHFNGILNPACKAGVKYADVEERGHAPGTGRHLPCLPSLKTGSRCGSCAQQRLTTAAEVEAQEAEFRKSMDDVMTARAAIVRELGDFAKGKSRGISGCLIPCPVCRDGALHYSRSAYNGHIHATCTTPTCVRWME